MEINRWENFLPFCLHKEDFLMADTLRKIALKHLSVKNTNSKNMLICKHCNQLSHTLQKH